jgi:hypothetical protein
MPCRVLLKNDPVGKIMTGNAPAMATLSVHNGNALVSNA